MQRTIKSYVLRAGRVSQRQQHALTHWLVNYELNLKDAPIALDKAFGRQADTVMEIGFGMGASLVSMAKLRPDLNFLGIEVHRAGIGSLVADLYEEGITNVRIATCDAVELIKTGLMDASLAGVQIFFPDPWPKARHHKRRLIQRDFLNLLIPKIKVGGTIHCATDWQNYAEQMLEELSSMPALCNQQSAGGYSERPDTRPITKFEARGQRLGHGVWDLIFIRLA